MSSKANNVSSAVWLVHVLSQTRHVNWGPCLTGTVIQHTHTAIPSSSEMSSIALKRRAARDDASGSSNSPSRGHLLVWVLAGPSSHMELQHDSPRIGTLVEFFLCGLRCSQREGMRGFHVGTRTVQHVWLWARRYNIHTCPLDAATCSAVSP